MVAGRLKYAGKMEIFESGVPWGLRKFFKFSFVVFVTKSPGKFGKLIFEKFFLWVVAGSVKYAGKMEIFESGVPWGLGKFFKFSFVVLVTKSPGKFGKVIFEKFFL